MKTSPVSEGIGESLSETESERTMDRSTAEGFTNERERLMGRLSPDEQAAARALQATLPDWRIPTVWPGDEFIRMSESLRGKFGPSTLSDISRLFIVELALSLDAKLAEQRIPEEVFALYPAASKRLLAYLREAADEAYYLPNDFFFKDARFASGLSVPCGAQMVDLRSCIGYRASIRWVLRNHSRKYLVSLVRSGQVLPWLRIHTESRYLDDFNEPGWDACYLRVAALLREHSDVLGMAGTSWFYDPQLDAVSPRLSYLRTRPLERGASLIWSGTSEFDIKSATAKSTTRRQLYEEGKYLPVSYNLLWPREALLAWANAQARHSHKARGKRGCGEKLSV